MEHIETFDGKVVFRSGRFFPWHTCPKHGIELELCVDDSDLSGYPPVLHHNDNRIQWHCDQCLGYWHENFFIHQYYKWLQPWILSYQLQLTCPRCRSTRITHDCMPGCCESHSCLDCQGSFESHVDVIEPKAKKAVLLRPYLDSIGYEGHGEPTPARKTGIFRAYRQCQRHPAERLELVLLESVENDNQRMAWYCKQCRVSYSEIGFRSWRVMFSGEAVPGVECPVCRSYDIDSLHSEGSRHIAICTNCGTKLRITLEERNC